LALLSLRYADLPVLRQQAQAILNDSGLAEFKWSKLRQARERFCAIKLCSFTVDHACRGRLRADVLVWDIRDSRHDVARRDDVANLERMYYHVFENVLRTRWPADSVWLLCPDQNTAVDWATIEHFLQRASTTLEMRPKSLTLEQPRLSLRIDFGIESITPCDSTDAPLVGVVDLLAGLAVYSRESYDCYEVWQRLEGPQPPLFPMNEHHPVRPGKSDEERCQVLAEFNNMCKAQRLGVSLRANRGLKTYDPKNPLNFWWYEPQHEADKAPVRMTGDG
jgi:hypothetical protein